MPKVGDRVGALCSAEEDTVKIYGFGVYEGDFVPEGVGGMGAILASAGASNPRIRLDSGKTVYGCECWWGPEEEIKAQVAQYDTVVEVDIEEARKKA